MNQLNEMLEEMGQQDVPESEKIWLALMVYTASHAAVYRDARTEENTVPQIPVNLRELREMLDARVTQEA